MNVKLFDTKTLSFTTKAFNGNKIQNQGLIIG
jgi:hypothetical protein